MPEMMRAVEITEFGGPEVLKLTTRRVPKPISNQVVIKVAYAGVNRPDALQRAGAYAPPQGASDLPGLEASGEIVAVGADVTRWKVGQQVCALLPGGGYSEFVVTSADHCLPIPEGMSLQQAACLPETCFTVWSNVVQRGGLKAGERILIHGGSSGIGTTAIQIAKALGAKVYTTAGTEKKCAACAELGADIVINYRSEDFVDALRADGGANVILDMVGGEYIPRNIKALSDDGRCVQIAFLQGAKVELNLASIMMRRLTLTGSTLRPQSDAAKAEIAQQVQEFVWPMIASGQFSPVMDSCFPLERAADAHRHMESSAHIGKICLAVHS